MTRPLHGPWVAFSPAWFARWQWLLLAILAEPVLGRWGRWVLGIGPQDVGYRRPIVALYPHAYVVATSQAPMRERRAFAGFRSRLVETPGPTVYTADVRTHPRFAKRIYFAFRPLWWLLHGWDRLIAERWVPALDAGFSTLAVNPDADPESVSVDGHITRGTGLTNESWATIIAGGGHAASDSGSTIYIGMSASTTSNQFQTNNRAVMLFNTATLGVTALVLSATMSLWGTSKDTTLGAFAVHMCASSPASNTALASSDYQTVAATTSFGTITNAAFDATDTVYSVVTLNGYGRAAIARTGVTKLGAVSGYDQAAAFTGSWSSGASSLLGWNAADVSGTTHDPKLTISYVLPAWVSPTTTVEAYLSGAWVDISSDLADDDIVISYGIQSRSPDQCCASTGAGRFTLRNGLDGAVPIGYYSFWHADRRTGWAPGIPIRIKQVYSGNTRYFLGRLSQAVPTPGEFEEGLVRCVMVDWMDEAARCAPAVNLQLNKRSDEVAAAIIAGMSSAAPENTSYATGDETFTYALDNISLETRALQMFSDLARSEGGKIFCKRDATDGQTFVFEKRTHRSGGVAVEPIILLDNLMIGIDVPGDRTDIINHVRYTCHPRSGTISGTSVVASLAGPFQTPLALGESVTLIFEYRDPAQRDTKIGAGSGIAPVATTDWLVNAASDGSSTNLTGSDFTVTATYRASYVEVVCANVSGATPGYFTFLRCRAADIKSLEPVTADAKDQDSIDAYGENLIEFDALYVTDPVAAQERAAELLETYKDPLANVSKVTFSANLFGDLLTAAITGDISDQVTLKETVTGVDSTRQYYINAVEHVIGPREQVQCTWWLAPAGWMS